ncbi:hypothetical protein [Nesterenkonia pannonica]|uniref:hypothetical protein n=1 Tax=Nesterenkonia pannonica TaxID=1548602 RepID=UPI002164CD2C|nr:hypothetical protein [Nesterenkonia pannonica]
MSLRSRPSGLVAAAAAAALILPTAAAPAGADTYRDMQFWLDDYGVEEAWETTEGRA